MNPLGFFSLHMTSLWTIVILNIEYIFGRQEIERRERVFVRHKEEEKEKSFI